MTNPDAYTNKLEALSKLGWLDVDAIAYEFAKEQALLNINLLSMGDTPTAKANFTAMQHMVHACQRGEHSTVNAVGKYLCSVVTYRVDEAKRTGVEYIHDTATNAANAVGAFMMLNDKKGVAMWHLAAHAGNYANLATASNTQARACLDSIITAHVIAYAKRRGHLTSVK
jgi:hypothetical protein